MCSRVPPLTFELPPLCAGRVLHGCLAFGAWAILAIAATIGAEVMYFVQKTELGAAYHDQLPTLFFFHALMGRPLVGLATAYLLAAAILGRAPRLNAFLSARLWRPFAALSYSMYLLQYIGIYLVEALHLDIKRYVADKAAMTEGDAFLFGVVAVHVQSVVHDTSRLAGVRSHEPLAHCSPPPRVAPRPTAMRSGRCLCLSQLRSRCSTLGALSSTACSPRGIAQT
eukprot:7378357-Prymnesium_polylepis.1